MWGLGNGRAETWVYRDEKKEAYSGLYKGVIIVNYKISDLPIKGICLVVLPEIPEKCPFTVNVTTQCYHFMTTGSVSMRIFMYLGSS